MSISPIADAASALRNLISCSPHRFTYSEALATLEKGWKLMYDSSNMNPSCSNIEDKKALKQLLMTKPLQLMLMICVFLSIPPCHASGDITGGLAVCQDVTENELHDRAIRSMANEL